MACLLVLFNPILNVSGSQKNIGKLAGLKGGKMAETKKVSVVERATAPEQAERPRKKPRANISRELKYQPFESALRHLVIKEKE